MSTKAGLPALTPLTTSGEPLLLEKPGLGPTAYPHRDSVPAHSPRGRGCRSTEGEGSWLSPHPRAQSRGLDQDLVGAVSTEDFLEEVIGAPSPREHCGLARWMWVGAGRWGWRERVPVKACRREGEVDGLSGSRTRLSLPSLERWGQIWETGSCTACGLPALGACGAQQPRPALCGQRRCPEAAVWSLSCHLPSTCLVSGAE